MAKTVISEVDINQDITKLESAGSQAGQLTPLVDLLATLSQEELADEQIRPMNPGKLLQLVR